MLIDLLLALLVLAVVLLMAVDLARAPSELPVGEAPEAGQDIIQAPGPIGTGAFRREPAVAPPDARPFGQRPDAVGPPAAAPAAGVISPPAARPPARAGQAAAGDFPGRLRNWPLRSRLLLLVTVPTMTAVVFGIVLIVVSLGRTTVNPVTGVVSRGSALPALVTAAVVIIVLALAVLLTIVVARSMTQPLRTLQDGAVRVTRLLPDEVQRISDTEGEDVPLDVELIGVNSADEIGVVARAFNEVHAEALRLAANEAALRGNVNAMFVSLSRRSQSLVERQLRLIDDLEQGEQDAERLGNLFRMDHLATRMRRNSENLLVLAGQEPLSRGSQPVALVDVIRAALSEIEEYERVTLNVQAGIMVNGPAVNDVVHTIAELAENATSLSAADTVVKISGHLLSGGGVVVDISDEGVGMREREMQQANWDLEHPPAVDLAISRRMGLFVVGRLAQRHGIRVRLRQAASGGVTALVWLPDELITYESTATQVRPGGPAATGAWRAPAEAGPPRPGRAAWLDTGQADRDQMAAGAGTPRFAALRDGDDDVPPGPRRVPGPRTPAGAGFAGPAAAPGGAADAADSGWAAAGPRPRPGASTERTGRDADAGDPVAGPVGRAATGLTGRDPGTGPAADAGAALSAPALFGPRPGPGRGGVTGPDAGGTADEQRLPVFEAVESDWFRHGRRLRPAGQAAEAGPGWASPADEGWHAAQVAAAPSSSGVTTAGLPKRVPQANLVPGTVAGAPASAQPGSPSRSAAATRERFASFQQGVLKGRTAAEPAPDAEGEEETS